ncbi:MAG: hypothetical protein HN593_10205 [Lentimicrobiaceae bacterium]|jgi:hypothetical protein|nr:hypothetical protein [Lentimicrobiaceae bacterium]MBT7622793.1 hypothetical protein [Lentimicrobiaceae bacterium]
MVFITLLAISQYVEPMPIVGQKSLKVMIKKHFDYPEYDLNNNISGNVIIDFETDKSGKVISCLVMQNVSRGIDSAAISLFKQVIWSPATYELKPVKGKASFELKYNKKTFDKLSKRRGYYHIIPPYLPLDTSYKIYNIKQLDTVPKPILEGSKQTLSNFIYSNLNYPEAAIKVGIEGEVVLEFIIEKNGLSSNIVATKYLGGGCTEEAMRIINLITWYPGILNGNAIRSKRNISIKFQKSQNRDGFIPNQQGSGI